MNEVKLKEVTIAGVTFHYGCELVKVADTWGDGYVRDVYRVIFLRGNRKIEFEYTQSFMNSERFVVYNKAGKEIKSFSVPVEARKYRYERKRKAAIPLDYYEMKAERIHPVEPTATDALCGAIIDANSYPMTFEDWCCEFGYDDDSRKAYDIWQRCTDLATKAQTLFSYDEVEEMRNHLEEEGIL